MHPATRIEFPAFFNEVPGDETEVDFWDGGPLAVGGAGLNSSSAQTLMYPESSG
jgi:hypothetical protein